MENQNIDVTAKGRKVCYSAKEKFHECLYKNRGVEENCAEAFKYYNTVCLPTWVKHFEAKRRFGDPLDTLKEKLEKT